jgi:hypothetical protein
MGNKKIWEPTLILGGAVIGFGAIVYALFFYKKDGKEDLFEIVGDKANKLTATMSKAFTQAGGSATKRHKKQSKSKGKSHKKH